MATQPVQGPFRKSTSFKGQKSASPHADGRAQGEQLSAVSVDSGRGQNGSLSQEERFAYGLGWFSIILGLAEFIASRRLGQAIGVPSEHHGVIKAMGLREMASGIGILTQRAPITAVWSRIAGDMIDLTCLGAALSCTRAHRGRLAVTAAAIAGATALDLLCAQQLSRGVKTHNGVISVTESLTIDRIPEDLYRYWRDFSHLPGIMAHLVSVHMNTDGRWHWKATGPAGSTVEWDAELTDDRPNDVIAWRSVEGSEIDHVGSIRFVPAPGGRGTMVTVEMRYSPPGGTLGSSIAAWFGEDPRQSVKRDLRRFKQVMETGEIITTEGQPAGRASGTSWKYDQAVRRSLEEKMDVNR